MFDVIGVIDLKGGQAVRAREGRREMYAPIERVAGESIQPGDAVALARQYVERFGLSAIYVADLDAIEQGSPQPALVQAIASLGVAVWLDAGISSSHDAQRAMACGASRVIAGLETLPSFQILESIVTGLGRERVVFSLDLRDGKPVAVASDLAQQSPEDLVGRAVDAGVGTVIVLDLARVGSGRGLDFEQLARIKASASAIELFVGGGMRGADDLEQVKRVGYRGALVASALLDGHVTAHVI